MADAKDRLAENVPGLWYVDSQCIDCDVCRVTAPGNFQRSDERGYSYVFRQPESAELPCIDEGARSQSLHREVAGACAIEDTNRRACSLCAEVLDAVQGTSKHTLAEQRIVADQRRHPQHRLDGREHAL